MRPIRAAIATMTLATMLAVAPASADEPPAANMVFVELGGNCVVGSANYERTVAGRVLLRLGLGVLPDVEILGSGGGVVFEQVGTVGTLVGSGRHGAELAAGVVLGEPSEGGPWGVHATAVIGYRYRSADGNIFRVGATPLLRLRGWGDDPLPLFVPLFGLSFGQSW